MGNKLTNDNYEPTEDEIIKYGIWLGLTLPDDEDLLYIARKSLKTPLPHPWKWCKTPEGEIYYSNIETGQSEREYPYDSLYKQIVKEAKRLNWLKNVKPACLLNYQLGITEDFNSMLKERENALNIETLRNKTVEILSRPNNPELEMDFRETCKKYQTHSDLKNPLLKQAYQDYLKAFQQNTSLYTLRSDSKRYITKLEIYNTETETKEYKILKKYTGSSEMASIAPLPNGKLFCYGDWSRSGEAMLIDMNGEVELLPSGENLVYASCIYYNNSVYCFGGDDPDFFQLAQRFDLDRKRWTKLTPMPLCDKWINSLLFNGNILASGAYSQDLWLYSIDIDSYSMIPYQSTERQKILINAERLYLIEYGYEGSVYESEIRSYTDWRQIAKSVINFMFDQVYCSYNKGAIYVRFISDGEKVDCHCNYYKFDLNKKLMIKL